MDHLTNTTKKTAFLKDGSASFRGRSRPFQRWGRPAVQIAFFLFIAFVSLSHLLARNGAGASGVFPWSSLNNLHALCIFGGIESAGRLLLHGRFVAKTGWSNLWLLGGAVLSTAVLGTAFCGYLCPLGSFQEWIGKLGRKLLGKRHNRFLPTGVDRALGYLRYAVLAIILVQTTRTLHLVFSRVDPYYALFRFWSGEVFPSAFAVLGAVAALSLFFERPWCRWFCPLGAVLGTVGRFSPWTIRVTRETCVSCMACEGACPMRITFAGKAAVRDTRCIRCGECLAVCMKEHTLSYSLPKLHRRERFTEPAKNRKPGGGERLVKSTP